MRAGGSGAAYAITGVGATMAAGGCCGCGGGGGGGGCCCCFGTSEGACVSAGASGIVDGGLEGGSSRAASRRRVGHRRRRPRGRVARRGEPASLDRDDAVSRCGDARVRPARSPSLEAYPLLRSGADDRGRGAGEESPPPAVSD